MAEKEKISKKGVPFLRKDLELDSEVVENLAKLQEERQKKFQSKIEAAQKEALEKYTARIEALKKAKTETLKQYNEEIKKYQQLLKGLEGETKKASPSPKKAKSKKME